MCLNTCVCEEASLSHANVNSDWSYCVMLDQNLLSLSLYCSRILSISVCSFLSLSVSSFCPAAVPGDGASVCARAAAGVCVERNRWRGRATGCQTGPQGGQELSSCECVCAFNCQTSAQPLFFIFVLWIFSTQQYSHHTYERWTQIFILFFFERN